MDFLILSGRTEKLLCTISNDADTVAVLEAKQREALNKEHTFLFRIDASHEDARHVEKGNLIGFLDRDDESFFHLFKIIDVDDDHTDVAERIAECLYWPTELADEHVEDFRPTNTTARYAMEKAVEGTRVKVGMVGDLGINSTNFYRENPLSCFEKIIAKWGGELRFRVIIDDTGIVDRFADLLPRRGSNKGDRLEYAHNIEKIERRESIRDVKTALRGYGRGEESGDGFGRRIDFKDVEWSVAKGDPIDKPLGLDWVGDEEARDLYGAPNGDGTFRHKFGQFEDSEIEDPVELLQRTYETLQQAKQPFLNYRLNPVILEGENYELGDTLVVIDDDIYPPIQSQSRVIVHERDLLEEDNDVIEVGQFIPLITDVDDRIEKVIAKVNDRAGVWDNPPTKEITDTQFPDIVPPVPVEISTVGIFKTIKINWHYFTDSYIAAYEVYASKMKGFTPRPEDLIFRGKTSGILFEAGDVNQQWYFRIRTLNYHGTASNFSDEYVANTVTINGEREITPLTITNELIAENISADKFTFGTMDGHKVAVINLDADNIVGGDLELSRGLRITHEGLPVIEVRDGKVRITAPNVATKEDLEEIELTPGPQGPRGEQGVPGIQGPTGASGQTLYTWVKYATSWSGDNMSDLPDGKTYIGFAYNKTTPVESTDPEDYDWAKIEGPHGPIGPDGQSLFTWLKYADTPISGMSDSPAGKTYMGVAYNKTSPNESTNYSDYSWSLIRGEKGDKGEDGTGVVSNAVAYQLHTNGTTAPTGTWSSTPPTPIKGRYLWTRTVTSYSNNTSVTTYSVSYLATDGQNGEDGKGIQSTTINYQIHTSGTSVPTGTWASSLPTPVQGRYLWTRTVISFTDGTSSTSYSTSYFATDGQKGDKGDKGDRGEAGKGITTTTITYQLHTSGVIAPTGTWSNSPPTPVKGRYLWTRTVISYTDSSSSTTYSVSYLATDGQSGQDGKGVQSTSVRYQLHTNGTSAPSGTWLENPPTPVQGRYLWTRTIITYTDTSTSVSYSTSYYATDGQKGDKGDKGDTGAKGADGKGVTSAVVTYQNHTNGSTAPTGTWSNTIPSLVKGQYLWTRTVTTYTDNSSVTTYSVSYTATDGQKGDNGRGISSTTVTYQLSTSGTTTPTGTWNTSVPAPVKGQYLWTRTVISYTDNTSSTAYSTSYYATDGQKGDKGDPGPQGIQGPSGLNGISQYVHIRYSANSNGSSMTTTPQSNTAYIGLANTTNATAPTSNTAYTWSLFKGPEGNQGIQGPKGADGQTTYTWVKYADDENGTGLSDTPDGKRYIGLAFNKTTPTESNNARDYTWSPLYDNVKFGGRNLLRDSRIIANFSNNSTIYPVQRTSGEEYDSYTSIQGTGTPSINLYNTIRSEQITDWDWMGDDIVASVFARYSVENTGHRIRIRLIDTGNTDGTTLGTMEHVPIKNGWNQYFVVAKNVSQNLKSNSTVRIMVDLTGNNLGNTLDLKNYQIERGNIPSDHLDAPEDIEDQLDEKAEVTDMDNLAEIVSSVSAELNFKTGMGEFEALEEAFNERIRQDIEDKDQLIADLASIESRTNFIENLAGNNKLVTQFIETVITQSEEGIFVGNESTSTGILISDNRISFVDHGREVAYISNQTMQISHGIFVESATISDFKFEKIPGTSILAITWVGD